MVSSQTLDSLAKGLAREMVWGIQTMLPQGCTTQHGLVGWWWGAVSSAFFWRNVTFSPGCRHSWLSSCHPSPCVAMRITQLRRHSTGINGKHSAAGGVGGRTSHKQIFCYWIISGGVEFFKSWAVVEGRSDGQLNRFLSFIFQH